ncbi:MAG: HAD-IA family hydrolase [Nitrospirae bacterium]|nr:HAD-IA family hydrolase [Nitrospirota bacterium]
MAELVPLLASYLTFALFMCYNTWKLSKNIVKTEGGYNLPVQLIIFDLDGTLVNSIEDISASLNYALAQAGLPGIAAGQTLQYVGGGVDNLINLALMNMDLSGKPQGIKEAVLESFLNYYSTHVADFTRPYEGVLPALETLSGYKKAVVSNKTAFLSGKLLQKLGMDRYFDLISGSDSFDELKPSPQPISKTMEKLGAVASETVMVGDSSTDVEAGHRAGVKTIAVAYGYRTVETLAKADFLVKKSLMEIVPIIRGISG